MTGKPFNVCLIGAGRMGLAIAEGLVRAAGCRQLDIVEPTPSEQVRKLAGLDTVKLNGAARRVDILILAVKPQVFPTVADTIRPWIGADTVVVSIMAGISIRQMSDTLGTSVIIRAMPNLPAQIGEGATGFALGPDAGAEAERAARAVLAPLGLVVGPVEEDQISAIVGIAGSAPAYVFALVECLTEAGVREGLDPEMASALAHQTAIGAGALLASDRNISAAERREAVSSPGGVTLEALKVLMATDGLPSLIQETVRAAIRRDRELGETE
jgi:pyrroline-5-carboxylate reductase